MIDRDRLTRLFSGPELEPLLQRLRRRLERGTPLTGTIVLTNLSSAQLQAVSALLGRSPSATGERIISVPLDELAAQLAEAGICDSLPKAVELLTGPILDTPAAREARAAAWARVFDEAPETLRRPPLDAWFAQVRSSTLLQRLAGAHPASAAALLAQLARVTGALPAGGMPLASFAAAIVGDAHALDPGTPLASLALRAVAHLGGVDGWQDDAEGRRAAWASVGVMCNELSTPALVLNLPTRDDSPLGRLLATAAACGEPLHVSLRLLLRCPLRNDARLSQRDVFICENPTIVALAAGKFGARCAPLVCVNGQFATPALVLLRQLRSAGARLHYHGDFDPAGLAIARRAMAETGARPWRFGAADYLAAPKGVAFLDAPGPTRWDPALGEVMRAQLRAVHEEAVFETLALDLAGGFVPRA